MEKRMIEGVGPMGHTVLKPGPRKRIIGNNRCGLDSPSKQHIVELDVATNDGWPPGGLD